MINKLHIYILLLILPVSVNAYWGPFGVRKELRKTQFNNQVAFSSMRIGSTTITNNNFDTNDFPVPFVVTGTDGFVFQAGRSSQRPHSHITEHPILRYNTDLKCVEFNYNNSGWGKLTMVNGGSIGNLSTKNIIYCGNTTTIPQLLYTLKSNGWVLACATNETTMSGLLGFAMNTNSSLGMRIGGDFFTSGLVYGNYYISTNPGHITTNKPNNEFEFVRRIGYGTPDSLRITPTQYYLSY